MIMHNGVGSHTAWPHPVLDRRGKFSTHIRPSAMYQPTRLFWGLVRHPINVTLNLLLCVLPAEYVVC